jgi:predicted molibdopterin-dependent oxidoreductase YjgC
MFRKLHEPTQAVTVHIDGTPVSAEVGETVAAVLLRQAEPWARVAPVSGARRAPYCLMGACFDCLAEVEGLGAVQTCLMPVSEGMRVSRLTGRRELTR